MAQTYLECLPKDIRWFLLMEEHPVWLAQLCRNSPQLAKIQQSNRFLLAYFDRWIPSLHAKESPDLVTQLGLLILQESRPHPESLCLLVKMAFEYQDERSAVRIFWEGDKLEQRRCLMQLLEELRPDYLKLLLDIYTEMDPFRINQLLVDFSRLLDSAVCRRISNLYSTISYDYFLLDLVNQGHDQNFLDYADLPIQFPKRLLSQTMQHNRLVLFQLILDRHSPTLTPEQLSDLAGYAPDARYVKLLFEHGANDIFEALSAAIMKPDTTTIQFLREWQRQFLANLKD